MRHPTPACLPTCDACDRLGDTQRRQSIIGGGVGAAPSGIHTGCRSAGFDVPESRVVNKLESLLKGTRTDASTTH